MSKAWVYTFAGINVGMITVASNWKWGVACFAAWSVAFELTIWKPKSKDKD